MLIRAILFLLLIPAVLTAGPREFFTALSNGSSGLVDHVDQSALQLSQRLGITYKDQPDKFLISYDLPLEIKEHVNNSTAQINEADLGSGYSSLTVSVPEKSFSQTFYFLNGKYVSSLQYLAKDYRSLQTKYFNILTTDDQLTNKYAIDKLNAFADTMLNKMSFSIQDKILLQDEKIIYILCKDEAEIEKIVGVKTRGIYIVAYDAVVSTYNSHYHEISHLLMNYKLRKEIQTPLLFFLEGFAVAQGGRGGLKNTVLFDIASYLLSSGFSSYTSIISNTGFTSEDPSITYPVAGLYNRFLLDKLGFERYLDLYKKCSGDQVYLSQLDSSGVDLPPASEYLSYLDKLINSPDIVFNYDGNFEHTDSYPGGSISFDDKFYRITVKDSFMINVKKKNDDENQPYMRLDPYNNYLDEKNVIKSDKKYLIKADENSVNIYNLYTNELIASYSKGFSTSGLNVPRSEDRYSFYVRKNVFDEDLILTYLN